MRSSLVRGSSGVVILFCTGLLAISACNGGPVVILPDQTATTSSSGRPDFQRKVSDCTSLNLTVSQRFDEQEGFFISFDLTFDALLQCEGVNIFPYGRIVVEDVSWMGAPVKPNREYVEKIGSGEHCDVTPRSIKKDESLTLNYETKLIDHVLSIDFPLCDEGVGGVHHKVYDLHSGSYEVRFKYADRCAAGRTHDGSCDEVISNRGILNIPY